MKIWKTIQTFSLPQDAYLARALLESREIETNLADELTAQVHNFYSGAIGGVKLQVLEPDVEEGIQILKEGGYIIENKEDFQEPEILYADRRTDKTICPYCKSKNIGHKKNADILAVIVYFILGVFFPIFRRSQVCFDCNKQWKYKNRRKE